VICHRVAYLVRHARVAPSSIVLVTFTNKGGWNPPPFKPMPRTQALTTRVRGRVG
jgi:superfamily I DNA/RNA helicase